MKSDITITIKKSHVDLIADGDADRPGQVTLCCAAIIGLVEPRPEGTTPAARLIDLFDLFGSSITLEAFERIERRKSMLKQVVNVYAALRMLERFREARTRQRLIDAEYRANAEVEAKVTEENAA